MNDETQLVPTGTEAVAPVPVAVDELATKVVAALEVIAAIIPDLRKPHPATAKKVRGGRTVSREAVGSILAMVEASPALQNFIDQNLIGMNLDRTREVLSSADDYRLLGERLEMLCAQVKYTAEARWAEVVAQAMHAYHMACILAGDPKEAELAAHVATIRRHLGRRNGATGKRTKESKPE
ncbi:MAG TPA: hypothetical protein VKB93_28820 [Thermoanaerobaculia bacterium]|nr:hypothetical protein [Thermoanaerobaculia bacterium]